MGAGWGYSFTTDVHFTPLNTYSQIPEWFLHPEDEGKPCNSTNPPAKLKVFKRTDPPPTRTQINMSIQIQIEGEYKDLAIIWWTCWRPDGLGGVLTGCNNKESCSFGVFGLSPFGVDVSTGPHLTQTRIRYLSCENGKWVKHLWKVGRSYRWEDGHWVTTTAAESGTEIH